MAVTVTRGNRVSQVWRSMHLGWKTYLALFILVASVLTAGKIVWADDGDREGGKDRETFAIGLWGDLPYNDVQAQVGLPNMIADMNSQDLAFTVHDGDLKAGNGTPNSTTPTICSDALYTQALGYFNNSLRAPAILTP